MNPTAIHYDSAESAVNVTWEDGHVSKYFTMYLRGWCACAACQGHFATEYRYIKNDGPALEDAVPIGAYGVNFHWSDGHDSGIFTFRELPAMCPCDECKGHAVARQVSRGSRSTHKD